LASIISARSKKFFPTLAKKVPEKTRIVEAEPVKKELEAKTSSEIETMSVELETATAYPFSSSQESLLSAGDDRGSTELLNEEVCKSMDETLIEHERKKSMDGENRHSADIGGLLQVKGQPPATHPKKKLTEGGKRWNYRKDNFIDLAFIVFNLFYCNKLSVIPIKRLGLVKDDAHNQDNKWRSLTTENRLTLPPCGSESVVLYGLRSSDIKTFVVVIEIYLFYCNSLILLQFTYFMTIRSFFQFTYFIAVRLVNDTSAYDIN